MNLLRTWNENMERGTMMGSMEESRFYCTTVLPPIILIAFSLTELFLPPLLWTLAGMLPHFHLFFNLRGRKREEKRESTPFHLFISKCPQQPGLRPEPQPVLRNSIQVSHMGDGGSVTRLCCLLVPAFWSWIEHITPTLRR